MKELRTLAIVAMTVVCALATAASSQTAPDNFQQQTKGFGSCELGSLPWRCTSKPAPNAWMLTPTPYLEWNKNIAPSIRAGRDKYAEEGAQELPLTDPHVELLGPGIGCGLPKTEIPPDPNRVVLTGTFTKQRSVLSASERSLYNDVTVHVDKVFEDQGASGAFHGGDVTIMIGGGTVTLASGLTLTYDTWPARFSLQPDHRYLLVLSYHREGDFFIVRDDWSISDGIVRPNTEPGEYRAKHGLSSLNGLTVQQLGPALDKLLRQ
jgi:hypothetical protein